MLVGVICVAESLLEIPLNYAIDVVILNQKGSRRISSYC
jgi:hypothetical protein